MADTFLEPNIPRNRGPKTVQLTQADEHDSGPEMQQPRRRPVPVRPPAQAPEEPAPNMNPDAPSTGKPRETWFERNRNLIFVGMAILIVLVILLIWHMFTRQTVPRQVAVVPGRGPGGVPTPPQGATHEPAPSEGVDGNAQTAETAEAAKSGAAEEMTQDASDEKTAQSSNAGKPTPGSKKPAKQAGEKAQRRSAPVSADSIVTADDEEINKFVGMDTMNTPAQPAEVGELE